jgi:hypothetical protein
MRIGLGTCGVRASDNSNLMLSLRQVMATLRREIDAALGDNQPLPRGTRLEADRVIVTLQFSIRGGGDDAPVDMNFETDHIAGHAAHSLAIEFKCYPAAQAGIGAPINSAVHLEETTLSKAMALEGSEADWVTEQLTVVLGVPGFDSSARATVFREAFENLSEEHVDLVIRSLSGAALGEKPDAVKRSISLVHRITQSSPAGSTKGKAVLVEIFRRHSVPPIIKLIATVWKTQEHWMA